MRNKISEDPSSPRSSVSNSLRQLLIVIGLAAVCLLAYSNSFYTQFQYDDIHLIRFNFTLRDITQWKAIFEFEKFRPLLMATFALNFQISQKDPFSYHVVNLLLHMLAVTLFYLLLSRSSGNPLFCAIAAALMAAHPLNTESVTYIASRSTVLCAIFYFASLLALDSYLRKPRRYLIVAFFCAFALGVLTKEEAILIPIAGLLYNFLLFGRDSVRKHRVFHLVGVAIVFSGAVSRLYFESTHRIQFPVRPEVYIPTEVTVWFRYLWLAIYPVKLSVDHSVAALSFRSFQFWIALLGSAATVTYLWKLRAKHPVASFWGLWFFLNLLPSSFYPLNEFMAEHRAYLSMFGFCSLVGYCVTGIQKPSQKPSKLILAAIFSLLVFYTGATRIRNNVWEDHYTLWYDAVEKSPWSPRARLNLASAHFEKEEYREAIQEYLFVRSLLRDSPFVYSGLGMCYLRTGHLEEAERNFQQALRIDPRVIDAKTGLGMVHYQRGNYPEALRYLTEVYQQRKESVLLVALISDSYLHTGSYDEAIFWSQRGLKLEPGEGRWYVQLMEAYFRSGRFREALEVYNRYRKYFPKDGRTRLELARMLAASGRPGEARQILGNLLQDPAVAEEARRELKILEQR